MIVGGLNVVAQPSNRATLCIPRLLGLREPDGNGLLALLDLRTLFEAAVELPTLELAHDLPHPSPLLRFGSHGSKGHAARPTRGSPDSRRISHR
jgi:hypothetical protein